MKDFRFALIPLVLLSFPLLKGCAVAAVGAATTTGVAMAADRRTAGTIVDDQSIEIKALHQLAQNKELWKRSHFNIACYNGVVLLAGQTPNENFKQQAENALRDIPKIKKIYNEMKVGEPVSFLTRSQDTLITTQVKAKMVGSKEVNSTRVKVVTEDAVVYLMGMTKPSEQIAATEIARTIKGVDKVVQIFEAN